MKAPVRNVSVDLGYGPGGDWTTVKVVRSQIVDKLFGEGQAERLLVEIPGGERIWVSHWREV